MPLFFLLFENDDGGRHNCCWVLSIQNGSNETVVGVGVVVVVVTDLG